VPPFEGEKIKENIGGKKDMKRDWKKRISLAIAMILIFGMGFLTLGSAQQDNSLTLNIPQNIKKYDIKNIDPGEMRKKVKQGMPIEIDFGPDEKGGRRVYNILLEPNDLLTPDAKIIIEDGGKQVELPRPEVTTYKGKIVGKQPSSVRMSITQDWLSGYVISDEGWYFIEPLSRYNQKAEKTKYFTYKTSDVDININFTDDAIMIPDDAIKEESDGVKDGRTTSSNYPGIFTSVSKYADIYLTSNAEFYQINPSDWEARQMSVLNYADDPYITQTRVGFRVGLQHTYTSTNNQAYTSTDPSTLLSQVRNRWKSSGGSRDLVYGLMGKDFNGCTLGIAYQNTLGNKLLHYGISQQVWDPCSTTFATDFMKAFVMAHEMGHIFNANHQYAECSLSSTTIMGDCTSLYEKLEFSDGVPYQNKNNKQRIIDKSAVL
jgi:Metallo-peptidase family M12